MTKPIGYFAPSAVAHPLAERYGSHLEKLTATQKLDLLSLLVTETLMTVEGDYGVTLEGCNAYSMIQEVCQNPDVAYAVMEAIVSCLRYPHEVLGGDRLAPPPGSRVQLELPTEATLTEPIS